MHLIFKVAPVALSTVFESIVMNKKKPPFLVLRLSRWASEYFVSLSCCLTHNAAPSVNAALGEKKLTKTGEKVKEGITKNKTHEHRCGCLESSCYSRSSNYKCSSGTYHLTTMRQDGRKRERRNKKKQEEETASAQVNCE